ncbi:poly(U)-specific 3'-to-5' RNA exonuclease [Malassezia yamatoensis]|uniref:U6 snRNA phosphodiesterase 1 n=1 Tax=Malassezia yamatoensis TaxID=253288 RepID=A0AAJ6CJ20_9BASI|nr:poly(U)-specific 3'-to-5' RNA exonuclease [Malassezia yamatoensis]
MKPLVAYSDSDEEAHGLIDQQTDSSNLEQFELKAHTDKSTFQTFAESNDGESSRLPALRWGKTPYENSWLCHVYIPVKLTRNFHHLLRQNTPEGWNYIMDQAALHLSLTRPIVLQRHETQAFLHGVRDAVKKSGISQFAVGFAQFSCFPSDTSSRIFLSLETSSGWTSMQQLTQVLSKELHALFSIQKFYEQPRFHVSFAYREVHSCDPRQEFIKHGHKIAQALNRSHGATLQSQPAIYANAIAVQTGRAIEYVNIPHTGST